jgi:hypothetical protein
MSCDSRRESGKFGPWRSHAPVRDRGGPVRVQPASPRWGRLHDPHLGKCRNSGLTTALGPLVATTLIKPGVSVADPKRQSRRQRQIAPAAVRANTGISVRVGCVQILDHDVPERLGLRLFRRHVARTLHDDSLVLNRRRQRAAVPELGKSRSHERRAGRRTGAIRPMSWRANGTRCRSPWRSSFVALHVRTTCFVTACIACVT